MWIFHINSLLCIIKRDSKWLPWIWNTMFVVSNDRNKTIEHNTEVQSCCCVLYNCSLWLFWFFCVKLKAILYNNFSFADSTVTGSSYLGMLQTGSCYNLIQMRGISYYEIVLYVWSKMYNNLDDVRVIKGSHVGQLWCLQTKLKLPQLPIFSIGFDFLSTYRCLQQRLLSLVIRRIILNHNMYIFCKNINIMYIFRKYITYRIISIL